MLLEGLHEAGAHASSMPKTTVAIDACLASGGVACIAGRPQSSWGRDLDARGGYLHTFQNVGAHAPGDAFGHWVTVLGKTSDGLYIVADPLSKLGCIAVNAASIERFFADGTELGCAVDVRAERRSAPRCAASISGD